MKTGIIYRKFPEADILLFSDFKKKLQTSISLNCTIYEAI